MSSEKYTSEQQTKIMDLIEENVNNLVDNINFYSNCSCELDRQNNNITCRIRQDEDTDGGWYDFKINFDFDTDTYSTYLASWTRAGKRESETKTTDDILDLIYKFGYGPIYTYFNSLSKYLKSLNNN